jgi:hypothetical protein
VTDDQRTMWYVIAAACVLGIVLVAGSAGRAGREERCAAKWAPREVEVVEATGRCRVKVNGEWWPEEVVRVSE